MPKSYAIRVEGRLSDDGREALCELRIVDLPPQTLLYGEVIDEAHLHGIIAQLRALGVTVVSVHPAE